MVLLEFAVGKIGEGVDSSIFEFPDDDGSDAEDDDDGNDDGHPVDFVVGYGGLTDGYGEGVGGLCALCKELLVGLGKGVDRRVLG